MRVVRVDARILRLITFGHTAVMNPFNDTLYCAPEYNVTPAKKRHEQTHIDQKNKLGLRVYLWRVLAQTIVYRGWKNTPLELEAIESEG